MFDIIIATLAENAKSRTEKFINHMAENVRTIGALRTDHYARSYTTTKQLERLLTMDDTEAIPAADYEKILMKEAKAVQKSQQSAVNTLYSAATFTAPENVCIHITWKHNNTWGWNPHVECVVDYESSTHGTASGCGYDKTSAAIAEALNASKPIMKALYTWVNDGGYTYGINTPKKYGFISAPTFEGGCGVNTIIAAFKEMGYDYSDHTTYTKRGNTESRYIHFWKK